MVGDRLSAHVLEILRPTEINPHAKVHAAAGIWFRYGNLSVVKNRIGQSQAMESLYKICAALGCGIGDIVEFINNEDD